jgi:hypothetical protein
MTTKKIVWHQAVFPGVQTYTTLCPGPGGMVFGFADRSRFFVFDPQSRRIVHQENTVKRWGTTNSQQGPRVFVTDGRGGIYVLFTGTVARLDPVGYGFSALAKSPVPIGPGGDFLDGRIYFVSGSHVCSYQLPAQQPANPKP